MRYMFSELSNLLQGITCSGTVLNHEISLSVFHIYAFIKKLFSMLDCGEILFLAHFMTRLFFDRWQINERKEWIPRGSTDTILYKASYML
mmetsp:Transcript_1939/g.2591  ORF Transcript_1939/g.2591 Transcript_1939/m.2591 type:complete len:90 (+) Transcript_1939:982-1251(+)